MSLTFLDSDSVGIVLRRVAGQCDVIATCGAPRPVGPPTPAPWNAGKSKGRNKGPLKRQTTSDKQQTTNNKQQTTNNKQQTTNDKRQATSDKQQTTNNKQQTTTATVTVTATTAAPTAVTLGERSVVMVLPPDQAKVPLCLF